MSTGNLIYFKTIAIRTYTTSEVIVQQTFIDEEDEDRRD